MVCNDLNLRAYCTVSTNTVQRILAIHSTTPSASIALGRTISAVALLAATLKPDTPQNITLRLNGTGPLREIQVQADSRGNIRGYVANPWIDLTESSPIDFSHAIGAGFISVTKDLGLKDPYTSLLPLTFGDIAKDISYYLTSSEQIPSALILGMCLEANGSVSAAGGILIQTYPETAPDAIEVVERSIANLSPPLGERLKQGTDIHFIVSELFKHHPLSVLHTGPLCAVCRCNKEMLAEVLRGLERGEIEDMIRRDGGAELTCMFCKSSYLFSGDELAALMTGSH
jgi:molecular chaperone Hsp33